MYKRQSIDNPLDGTKHKVYHIGESNIIIAPNSDGFTDLKLIGDSLQGKGAFRGIRFTDLSGQFRRNPITRYDFIKKGDIYDIRNEALTYDRMYKLNVFKNVRIEYYKAKDSSNNVEPVILSLIHI